MLGGGGLNISDIHMLSEGHQFVILLLSQLASIVSIVLLYRSSPKPKPPVKPGDAHVEMDVKGQP